MLIDEFCFPLFKGIAGSSLPFSRSAPRWLKVIIHTSESRCECKACIGSLGGLSENLIAKLSTAASCKRSGD